MQTSLLCLVVRTVHRHFWGYLVMTGRCLRTRARRWGMLTVGMETPTLLTEHLLTTSSSRVSCR
jgi:hypothetical protein